MVNEKLKKFSLGSILFFLCINSIFAQSKISDFNRYKSVILKSEILKVDRIIYIYLPKSYNNSNKKYPVHYVTDGPSTSNVFADLLSLHAYVGSMPEGIIIGLSSKNRENNMDIMSDNRERYLKFLIEEVSPFVDNNYRTNSFKSINGHSLGGGFALYTFLKNKDIFKFCIAGSPYPVNKLLSIKNQSDNLNTSYLYASFGEKENIDHTEFSNFQSYIDINYKNNIEYNINIHSGESHISNLAVNFQKGLEYFYSDWKFNLPESLETSIDVLLKNHYDKLSKHVGYKVNIKEWDVIFPVMDQLAKRGDFENAVNILKYCIKIHPDSDQAYAFLARAYMSMGNIELAKENLNKSLEINPLNQFALNLKQILNKQ